MESGKWRCAVLSKPTAGVRPKIVEIARQWKGHRFKSVSRYYSKFRKSFLNGGGLQSNRTVFKLFSSWCKDSVFDTHTISATSKDGMTLPSTPRILIGEHGFHILHVALKTFPFRTSNQPQVSYENIGDVKVGSTTPSTPQKTFYPILSVDFPDPPGPSRLGRNLGRLNSCNLKLWRLNLKMWDYLYGLLRTLTDSIVV